MSLCTINIIDGTVPSAMAVKEKLIWGISVKSVGWEQLECRVGERIKRMLFGVVCSVYSFHIRELAVKGSMVSDVLGLRRNSTKCQKLGCVYYSLVTRFP